MARHSSLVLLVSYTLAACSLSALAAPFELKALQETVSATQLTVENMEKGESKDPRARPPTPDIAGGAPPSDRYVMVSSTGCSNWAKITSTFSHQIAPNECQAQCQALPSCSGFLVGKGDDSGVCSVLEGQCDTQADTNHDLFLSPAVKGEIKVTPAEEQPSLTAKSAKVTESVTDAANATAAPVKNAFFNVTVVIPTVRRFQNNGDPAPERYLSPLVQKLWQDLTPEQQPHVNFLILNSDREPSKHLEALSLSVHPGVTVLSKPNWDEQLESTLRATGAIHENGEVFLEDGRKVNKDWVKWVAAEDMDGAYLLELGMKQSQYVLFLEDDVWPTTRALEKLNSFVTDMGNKEWLFLDLYTPNLNWAEGMLDVKDKEPYPFQCCTQAMLFRSDELPGIIRYWRTHPAEPVDDNLRAYRSKETPKLQIYAARPNLFEHVGAYSSNPQKSTGVVEHQSLDFVPLLL